MIYGYFNSGGGGAQLWRISAPNTIETTAPAVQQIDSPNFFNTAIRFISGKLLGLFPFVGSLATVLTKTFGVGAFDFGGAIITGIFAQDSSTGNNTIVNIDEVDLNLNMNKNAGGEKMNVQLLPGSVYMQTVNNGTNDETNIAVNSGSLFNSVLVGGVMVLRTSLQPKGFIVSDGVADGFWVEPNGKIHTNQYMPGGPGLPAFVRIPVYDTGGGGALLGYIDLSL